MIMLKSVYLFNRYIEGEETVDKPSKTILQSFYQQYNNKILSYQLYLKQFPKKWKKEKHIYNEESSKLLIEMVVEDSDKVSMYHIAVLFLFYNANPNYITNSDHKTFLHYLSSKQLLDCFEFLTYYYGDELDHTIIDNDQKQTILMLLCNNTYSISQERCVITILNSLLYQPHIHNIIDYQDIHGKTALDYAIEHSNYYIIQHLLISYATVQYNNTFHLLRQQFKYKKLSIEDSIDYHSSRSAILCYYRVRYRPINLCYRMLLFRYYQELKYQKKYIPSINHSSMVANNNNNNNNNLDIINIDKINVIANNDPIDCKENDSINNSINHNLDNSNNNINNNNINHNLDNNDNINNNNNVNISISYKPYGKDIKNNTIKHSDEQQVIHYDYKKQMRKQSRERKLLHLQQKDITSYESQIEHRKEEYMKKLDKEYHVSYHGLFA